MADLSPYAQAVEDNLGELESISTGLCGACPECQRDYGMAPREFYTGVENGSIFDEFVFSWSPCEACGSGLGGNRCTAHGIDENGDLVHFEVCEDCSFYLDNGDEPENWE